MNSGRATLGSWPASQRIVLSCDQEHFTVKDVLDAAWFRGALAQPWTRLLQARALEAQAAEANREADAETLQAMSEEFRYQRDLLTAEETERWLSKNALTEQQFCDYFLRAYWREQEPVPTTTPTPSISYPRADMQLLEGLRVDLLMSAAFDDLAEQLSWRLAALLNETEAPRPEALADERKWFLQRTGLDESELETTFAQLERDAAWLDRCLRMECAFRTMSARSLNEAERARALSSRRQGLTRVQIESLLAPTRSAAQEAVLCLRENQGSMEELAAACRTHCENRQLFLEDLANELQQIFLCAAPGDILDLEENETGFLVCRVVSKQEPELADVEVRSRIEQKLLQARFSELARYRIRWANGAARPHER